ncbi:unnamed protein product, partial [Pelagomonas calceolata]
CLWSLLRRSGRRFRRICADEGERVRDDARRRVRRVFLPLDGDAHVALLVELPPLLERRGERGADVALLQERPLAGLVAARQPRCERLDVRVEPDHDALAQRRPVLLPCHHASPRRHDEPHVGGHLLHDRPLELAEGRLPVLFEDVRDRPFRRCFECCVCVEECVGPELPAHEFADARLARAHHADQVEVHVLQGLGEFAACCRRPRLRLGGAASPYKLARSLHASSRAREGARCREAEEELQCFRHWSCCTASLAVAQLLHELQLHGSL